MSDPDPIFITYANADLITNPEIFLYIFEQFEVEIGIDFLESEAMMIIRIFYYFMLFTECTDSESFDAVLQRERSKINKPIDEYNNMSRTSLLKSDAYVVEDNIENVHSDCSFGEIDNRAEALSVGSAGGSGCDGDPNFDDGLNSDCILSFYKGGDGFPPLAKGKAKCYLCEQFIVRRYLVDIVEGTELSEIKGHHFNSFLSFLNAGILSLTRALEIQTKPNIAGFGEVLNEYLYFEPILWAHANISGDADDQDRGFSHIFISGFVSNSLATFLLNNDRRKLKKCPFCLEFFIADDIRRQRCKKEKCRKEYERQKKRKQRAENPAKYV